MGTLLAGRDGGVAVLSGAMNRVDPASSKPCLDDLEAKSPILIFLYFHKAIRTELDELQRSAMAFATGQLADIQPLFERYHFVRSIYKHHSNAEDEKSLETNCPICCEFLFTSSATVRSLPCGHYMHSACFQAYACRNYVCPICSKCMGDMADILCNDCEQKGVARFHWLYHKCAFCGSYNTKAIKSEPRNSDCPPSHQ